MEFRRDDELYVTFFRNADSKSSGKQKDEHKGNGKGGETDVND